MAEIKIKMEFCGDKSALRRALSVLSLLSIEKAELDFGASLQRQKENQSVLPLL